MTCPKENSEFCFPETLTVLKWTWLGLPTTLKKSIFLDFLTLSLKLQRKTKKTTCITAKNSRKHRHFAYAQSRRISAVTHINILSSKHAQTNASMLFLNTISGYPHAHLLCTYAKLLKLGETLSVSEKLPLRMSPMHSLRSTNRQFMLRTFLRP